MSLVGKVAKELVGFVGVLLDPLLKPVKERPNPNASKKKFLVRIFFGGAGWGPKLQIALSKFA